MIALLLTLILITLLGAWQVVGYVALVLGVLGLAWLVIKGLIGLADWAVQGLINPLPKLPATSLSFPKEKKKINRKFGMIPAIAFLIIYIIVTFGPAFRDL